MMRNNDFLGTANINLKRANYSLTYTLYRVTKSKLNNHCKLQKMKKQGSEKQNKGKYIYKHANNYRRRC